jgi:hypothetical protein
MNRNDNNNLIPESEKNIKKNNVPKSFLESKEYYSYIPNCWAGPIFLFGSK